jgi:hypothetical protein
VRRERQKSLSIQSGHLFDEGEDDRVVLLPFALGAAGTEELVNETGGG